MDFNSVFKAKDHGNTYAFAELYTEYGPLYLYMKYKEQKGDYNRVEAEIREFFTQELATPGYNQLEFMGREACFSECRMNWQGLVVEEYIKPLNPYDFLMKVYPIVEDDYLREQKIQDVYRIFNQKISKEANTKIIHPVSDEKANEALKQELASKQLVKYLK